MSAKLLLRRVSVEWPKTGETDARALLVRTARDGHAEIMQQAAAQGLTPFWEAYANRPGNSNLESAELPGPIVYNYRYLIDLIQFALDELRRQSPVGASLKYRNSHTVYVNGAPMGYSIPKTIQPDDKIYIANPVPYARRLEIGRTKGGARPFLISVPNRIYYRVTEMTKQEGKGRAKVFMKFIDLGAWTLTKDQKSLIKTTRGYAYSRRQRPDRLAGAVVTSPAIFFQAPI